MGEWELAVRSSSAPVHGILRRALAAHLVEPDDDPASPNFSLHVAENEGRGRSKDFHLLYRGVTPIVRTRELRRLVDGLLGYLSAVVERSDDHLLRLDVLALVKDGAAVLAPATIRSSLAAIERRLNAKGLSVVDRPWAWVDTTTAELVVPEPQLTVESGALDELGAAGCQDGAARPGRYPLVGWAFGAGGERQGQISRGYALTLAGHRLLDRDILEPQAQLERLAGVLRCLRPVGLWGEKAGALVDPLARLAAPSVA